jgi:hypothetical protein
MACAGNATEYCGAGYLLSLYNNTAASTVVPVSSLYQGCYSDVVSSRSLRAQLYTGPSNSLESCYNGCTQAGFSIAGAEYGQECWCGDQFDNSASLRADSECNMACTGNPGETCGGSNRLSVYSNGTITVPPTPSYNYTYAGCYSDAVNSRTLSTQYKGVAASSNTVESCIAGCASAGYSIAGLEYSQECWCDNSLTYGAGVQADADCSYACTGNASETCGGSNRLSVYSNLTALPTDSAPAASQSVGQFRLLGCYSDSVSNRTFPVTGNGGSAESCASSCSNYTYFGLEYSSEVSDVRLFFRRS